MGGDARWYDHFQKQFGKFLTTFLPRDPAAVLLGICLKELKTYIHTRANAQIFIVALLIISSTWEQPMHPSLGKQINTLSNNNNGPLFSDKKKQAIMPQKGMENF